MNETKVIKIFEDKQTKLNLGEQEIKDILLIKNIIGENNIILQADKKLLIRHYVGFVQVNKTRLLVYPKISKKILEEEQFEKSFDILMKMLNYSNFHNIKRIPEPQNIQKKKNDLFEVFIGLFIDELLLQFKRDINRGYNNLLENQTFIKGKIDFVETIKKNSFKTHLHYVNFDQFSENILLNRLFKFMIKKLISRTNDKQNKIKLKQGLLWLEDVDDILLNNRIWGDIKFTKHNSKYIPSFNMARLFYFNSSLNLNIGDEYTLSFLVPVNQLFELYLYKVLKEVCFEDCEVKYQSPSKFLAYNDNENYFKLKPDITLITGEEVKFIVDAKYKEMDYEEGGFRISQSDIYQMLSYGVGYRCNNLALIYPKILNNEDKFIMEEFKIENYDEIIKIKIISADLEVEPKVLGEELAKKFNIKTKGNIVF